MLGDDGDDDDDDDYYYYYYYYYDYDYDDDVHCDNDGYDECDDDGESCLSYFLDICQWDIRTYHLLDTCSSLDQCRSIFNAQGDIIYGGRPRGKSIVDDLYAFLLVAGKFGIQKKD